MEIDGWLTHRLSFSQNMGKKVTRTHIHTYIHTHTHTRTRLRCTKWMGFSTKLTDGGAQNAQSSLGKQAAAHQRAGLRLERIYEREQRVVGRWMCVAHDVCGPFRARGGLRLKGGRGGEGL